MQKALLFKKFLMPCGLCAAVPALKPDMTEDDKPCCEKSESKKLIRPSGLPIYSVEDSCTKGSPCEKKPSVLEQEIGKVRRSVQEVFSKFDEISDTVSSTFETGLQHSSVAIDYLREEENLMPRVGAIAIGGLTGAIIGLRGGTFKRLFYTSMGATTAAAICYPKQAEEKFQLAKHYTEIGVHFILGSNADEVKELKKNLQEFDYSQIGGDLKQRLFALPGTLASLPSMLFSKKEESHTPSESSTKQD